MNQNVLLTLFPVSSEAYQAFNELKVYRQTAETIIDLFVNEDIDYASRLIQAGVATDLQVINGVYHAFEKVSQTSPQTKAYHAARTEAIKGMLNP